MRDFSKELTITSSRPKIVDDIAYQDEVVAVLKKSLTSNDKLRLCLMILYFVEHLIRFANILDNYFIPNLLFYGPPGTGKTSAILALCRQIFGSEIYRDRVLELNASDERGIDVIRDKVKLFSQFAASEITEGGKKCPPLKMVILDEADSMTKQAQAALRRTMERESKTTRFCLICNYISCIIEPITSRCAKFRFKPLTLEIQIERLRKICENESVSIDDAALSSLISFCDGDLRRAINTLQSAASFKDKKEIVQTDIEEICQIVPEEFVEQFIAICRKGSHENMEKLVLQLQREAYSAYQFIIQLHDKLIDDLMVSDLARAKFLSKLAVCENRILAGADETLQLMDLGTAGILYINI
ncbi:replication factor C subunit 4 [Trichinella spiralis]|uniref:replication factor C subunit 4 n=1 Tax=Trichinella spiralis TaxID=6334 RepID=UPI0001EFD1AE|nr:replication factor C subunit 4 [Trichinella spiralis]